VKAHKTKFELLKQAVWPNEPRYQGIKSDGSVQSKSIDHSNSSKDKI